MSFTLQYLIIVLLLGLTSCSGQTGENNNGAAADHNKYVWTKLTDSAAFPQGYNFQLFSHRDTLWVFHTEGNWFSADGKHWQKSPLPNVINNSAFLDYVQFNDAVYGLGRLEGNIENFELTTPVHKTSDLKQWNTLSKESNLPKRFFYHPFVFNNKIWIIGGTDGKNEYADIWNSSDGVIWVKQKDNLPFGNRVNSQFVILNDKIFLLNHDVWSSTDGLNWTLETSEIVKGENIFGYAAILFDGHIWLLGCNRNGQFTSKILMSSDGKKWVETDAPWSARGAVAACVHKGRIYLTGGKYGGTRDQPEFIYSNDVWMMEIK